MFICSRKKRGAQLFGLLWLLVVVNTIAIGQQPSDDVIRINTELAQTGVTVFDKKGQFVDGLKKEDFELRVDGRLVPISFFENIVSGSLRDRVVNVRGKEAVRATDAAHSFRQRTLIFFLDDRHLSLDSVGRTRKTLSDFINKEMGPNDLVAIASSSGQLGFLQQFTDNKDVLRAAVGRLNHVPYVVSDYDGKSGSPMTEYMALTIERKDDSGVFEFYVQECLRMAPRGVVRQERATMRRHCEIEVQNRARQIVTQAGGVTANTYYSLETLLESAERLPGSKLAFFVSDGFLSDSGPRGPVSSDRVKRITDQARRAGVVIYSIDARGLVSGALDATGSVAMDADGRLESANARAVLASQDAMNALAVDTGGRALRNQNRFDHFINEAVTETSRYYLLAWRPEKKDEKTEVFKKVELAVIGRPDLTVRSARGFVSNRVITASKSEEKQETTPDDDLRVALKDFYPRQALPVQLSLMYLDRPGSGTVLTTSVQASTGSLSYGSQDKDPAELNIIGVVLNDRGKPAASFKTALKVNPPTSRDGEQSTVIYNYPSPLKPGIYQVRVAVRDQHSGILGSAMQWIVIPDLSTRQLSLSSLILGIEKVTNKDPKSEGIQWSVDRRFTRNTPLGFITFIYNAVSKNLAAKVQVYKDGQIVISTPFKNVMPDSQGDPVRIPFTSEIQLAGLQAGRYVLEVTIKDQTSQTTATQHTDFYVY